MGEQFEIKPSDVQITEATQKLINTLLKKMPFKVKKVKIKFHPGSRVEAKGVGEVMGFAFRASLLGWRNSSRNFNQL